MNLQSQKKETWLSGEICVQRGAYYSDVCGHKIVKDFQANDIFSRCPACHQAIRWIRFNGANSFAGR